MLARKPGAIARRSGRSNLSGKRASPSVDALPAASPFEAFIAPARHRAALWRTLAGVAIVLVGWFAFIFAGAVALALISPASIEAPFSPPFELMLLASFAAIPWLLAAVLRLLHRRRFATLLGARHRIARHVSVGVMAFLAVTAVASIVEVVLIALDPDPPTFALARPVAQWALIALAAVPLILVQCTAEEILFRGYLLQQFAARYSSPVVYALLPSIAFAALHFDPTLPREAALGIVLSILLFALLAVDLTARTGSLGAAIGWHVANNTVALLSIGTPLFPSGLALVHSTDLVATAADIRLAIARFVVQDLAIWAVLRLVLRPGGRFA